MDLTTVKPTTKIPKTVIPISELPKTIVPTIDVLRTATPRTAVPTVSNTSLYNNYTRTNQQVSPFSDYNDPTQINSFADVIWDTISKNNNLVKRDYGILSDIGDWDIPLLSNVARTITSTIDLTRNTVIEPIKQGNATAVGINTLVNLGESLDILASPIKGLILNGPKGLVKGSVGRVNYDFDTGNWLLDILAEVVVDPFNWISLGGKAALSSGAKALLASSIDDVAQAAGGKLLKEGIEETTQAGLKKKLIKSASRELFDKEGKFIAKNTDDILDSLFRAANRLGTDYFDDAFLQAMADKQIRTLVPQYITDLSILKGIQGIANISETAEKVMFEGAMYSNFIPIEQLKNIKQWGIFKNYTNKIVTEVGQAINGYINPAELTKLANYKTVTNPKNIEYQKLKVNQILKGAGLDKLSYIDVDNAFSDKALEAARNIKILIQEYSATQDFDTFLKRAANNIVPEDMVAESSNLYRTLMNVIDEDLKLIEEITNKDGIKVFSNLSDVYEELKNNIKNVYEYARALKSLKEIRNNVTGKDIILSKHQQELVQKYKDSAFRYIAAYENNSSLILKFMDKLELEVAKDAVDETAIKKVINDFIQELSTTKYSKKVTKDLQDFYSDMLVSLKACKTIDQALFISDKILESTNKKIKQLQDINSMYTIFRSKQALPIEVINEKRNSYVRKKDFINNLISETKLGKINEKDLDTAIQKYYKILNSKTLEIPETELSYFKDMFKTIETFQNKINNMPKDLKSVKEEFKKFSNKLKELANAAENTSKYCEYLISHRSAARRYKDISNNINRATKALNEETYNKKLTELRKVCAGGMNTLNEIQKQANKKTTMCMNQTGLVISNELNSVNKKTVFNTKNVAIKTTNTPEGAYKAFYDLFETTQTDEGIFQIGPARKLLDEMEFTSIIPEANDTVIFRKNLIDTIDELEEEVINNPELFNNYLNRKKVTDLIENMQEYIFYIESEITAYLKKITNRRVLEYSEIKDLLSNYIQKEKNNYLQDLIKLIDEAKESIGRFSITDTHNKEFLAGAVGVMYSVKDENLMLLYNALSEDIGLATEVKAFTDFDSMPYKQLMSLINDKNTEEATRQAAIKFSNDIKQFNALDNFIKRISSDPDIPDGALRSVMSSLESFKNTQLGNLDIDRFTDELYKKINNFIYGVDSPKSLSVENLLKEADVKITYDPNIRKRYIEEFTETERLRFNKFLENGETHVSEDDAFVQEMLIRLFMPDEYIGEVIDTPKGKIFLNKDGGRIYIADCETSSKYGTINEVAIKAMGSDETVVFKVAYHDDWEIPHDDILRKMFPDIKDHNTLVEKYKELYNPSSEINKKLIEENKVIFFSSEKELLENYKNYLDSFNMGDEVIMHNGIDFDYPALKERCFTNGVYLNSTKIKLSDDLVSMKENLPLIKFDSTTQIKINNYIKQYLSELPDDDPTTFFLTAANSSILKNITDLEKILTKDNINKTYNETLIKALIELKNKYYNLLDTNEKLSNGFKNILISKDFFKTIEGKDILLNSVKEAKATTEEMLTKNLTDVQRAEYETYLKSLNDTLELADLGLVTSNNISRSLYINRFEGDPALAVWKSIDLDTARNYMDIPDDLLLSENEMKAITNFVRPLQNTYDAIRNVAVLIDNKTEIYNTLISLLDRYLKDVPGSEGWLRYLRKNPDNYKDNYVVLQKIYNKYKKYLETTMHDSNAVYKKLEQVVNNSNVFELLRDSSERVFKKPALEDTLFGKFKNSMQSGEFYESSKAYKEYKDKFNNIVNTGLTALSDSIDGTIFTSAFKFKTAQQTQIVSEALDEFTNWMDTLSLKEQEKIIKNLTTTTEYMDINLAKQILELPDNDLLNFILTNSMFLQVDTKLMHDFDPLILNNFLERKNNLKALGLEIDLDKDLGLITIYPNKSVGFRVEIDASTGKSLYEINGVSAEPTRLNPIAVEDFLDYMPDNVKVKFKDAQNAMNLLSNNAGTGVTYQPIDRAFYRKAYENLPNRIKNNMLDLEYFLKDGLFNDRTRFNTTILGSQKFKSMYGDYVPNNFIKGYMNSFITLASRASDKASYIEMILNKDFSINNGFINELSFDEMRKMLEDAPEFNLACLTYNKSGNIELVDLKLNTEVDFQFAKKNNAVILPYHVFANAYQVINSKTYEEMNPVVRFMTKAMHMYKRGYLMSGGMVMRNVLDTFAKNVNIADGNVIEALSKTMDAMKLYTDYNDVLNKIFKNSGNQRINKESIIKFFNSGISKKMDYETFSFVHEVLNSGALIGEVKALDNYRLFSKIKKAGADVSDIKSLDDVTIKALSEDFDSVKHLSNGFMRVNNDIENIQRLSAYMLLEDKGLNFTEAIYRVSKDHFNYSMKSPREKLMELIIPFYTFKLNNLQYWAEALADNPWIAGLFEDIMTPIWDFDDADEKELQYNRSLQYRILSGNIQVADNGLTLKLNPSASDALKLMTNPLGEIYNSVFALYTFVTDAAMTQIAENTGNAVAKSINTALNIYKPANPTKLDTIKSLINLAPYGAIAQRAISGVQYAKELNNILPALAPSVFGRTKQYAQKQYSKKYYNTSGYNRRSYSKRQKIAKPKKIYPKRNWTPYRGYDNSYPVNFKNIYIDGMYSVPNINTYTAKANRYYNFTRLNHLPTVSIYDKLYTAKGKSRWDAMLKTVTPQNLKYVIKNTIHYK